MRRAPELILSLALAATPAAGDIAYVTNQSDSTLSVIDTARAEELARIDVPGQPAGIAVHPGGHVYVVSPETKTVRRLSAAHGTVEAEVTLDGGPTGIALSPARVFVSDWYGARIWVLDTDLSPETTLETGAAPAGLAVSPDGRFLASADRDADQVSIFDAANLARLHRIPVGTRPYGLTFAPDGLELAITNVGSNDISLIDPVAGIVTATLPVGERPYGIAYAEGRIFVTNQYAGTISVIDGATHETRTLSAGEYPEGIWPTSDGHLAVANWFDNTLTLLDAGTLKTTAEIPTGDGPRAFGAFILEGTPWTGRP